MKKYNLTETAVGGLGTLCLAIGLGIAAFISTPLVPGFLTLGGLSLTTSNIFAAERYRKEIKFLRNKLRLDYLDIIKEKETILKKGDQNLHGLTEKEKAFYRDVKKVEAYKTSYYGKIADTIGTALATGIALSTLLTLMFPPAGLLLTGTMLTTLAVVTAASTIYSLYKNYKTNKNYNRFKDAETAIEKDKIREIFRILKPKVAKEKEEQESVLEPSAQLYTPSFEIDHNHSREASEIESPRPKNSDESEPDSPIPR